MNKANRSQAGKSDSPKAHRKQAKIGITTSANPQQIQSSKPPFLMFSPEGIDAEKQWEAAMKILAGATVAEQLGLLDELGDCLRSSNDRITAQRLASTIREVEEEKAEFMEEQRGGVVMAMIAEGITTKFPAAPAPVGLNACNEMEAKIFEFTTLMDLVMVAIAPSSQRLAEGVNWEGMDALYAVARGGLSDAFRGFCMEWRELRTWADGGMPRLQAAAGEVQL